MARHRTTRALTPRRQAATGLPDVSIAVDGLANRTELPLTIGIADLAADGTDAAFRDFVADLFAASSAMQAVRRSLGKATGQGGVDIAILLAIQRLRQDGAVSVRSIADHLHLAAPQVTAGVGKLVAAGLLAKHDDPSDSRAIDVRLTAKGQRKLRQLADRVRTVNDVLFAGMSGSEMQHVRRFLRRIVDQCTPAIATLDPAD